MTAVRVILYLGSFFYYFFSFYFSAIFLLIDAAAAQDEVALVSSLPPSANGSICPGQNVVFNCTVVRTHVQGIIEPTLIWIYNGTLEVRYTNGMTTGNAINNDVFSSEAVYYDMGFTVISSATISRVLLSQHNKCMKCDTAVHVSDTKCIKIAGALVPPLALTITSNKAPATLTWLPPVSDLNCSFNYTVNITANSSSVTEQISYSTSLILTDLTHGENYSFAVAVTDSTGQHGPWSEELRVTWNVPGVVTFTTVLFQNNIIVSWMRLPALSNFPVLHYVVSYTVINNISNTTVQSPKIQYSTSKQQYSYTIPVEQGNTYYITVFAVNVVGTGAISEHSKIEVVFSNSDLMSQTDDTNPSQTNTYLYTSKTGIMVSNDHTVSQFPVNMKSSSIIATSLQTMIPTMIPPNPIIISGAIGGTIIILVSIVALSTAVIFIGKHWKTSSKRSTCAQDLKMVPNNTPITDLEGHSPTAPPRPPPPVHKDRDQVKSRKDGNIIYADLGTSLNNKPEIPPPPDRVIYSDTCEMTAIKKATDQKKEHTIIYADLGVASGKRPIAPPLSSFDQVVYSSVHQPATQM